MFDYKLKLGINVAHLNVEQGYLMTEYERNFVPMTSPTASKNGAEFYPSQGLYHELIGSHAKTAMIDIGEGARLL